MFRQLFVSFAIFSVAFACEATESEGPCDGTLLLCSTQVCDTAAGQCCPVTTASASSTTVASSSSTVSSSSSTTASSSSSSSTTCADRLNPSTGVSDCPALAYLCNDSTYYTVMTQQCPRTCGRCNTTSTSSSTCADLLNPSTGVSDCPARASLCNDSTYYAIMTQQCPRTCGRCNSTSTTTSTGTTCADRSNPLTGASDCPSRAALCNNAVYYNLMTVQCPVTCGRCSTNSTSSSSTTSCADRVNPSTGVSDCPSRASLCNNSVYYDLMTVQCPATCGRCTSSSSTVTSSSSTTASSTCADLVNSATGVSDCPNRVAYCTNAAYISLMRVQCPLTCGFCTSG